MSEFEFWKDIGSISDAILNYQKKNAEFNSRFINPWIRLGNFADQNTGNSEIIQAYRHATEIDPGNARNWSDLGSEQLKAGAYGESALAYQKAVDLSPRDGWALSNLAYALVMQDRVEDAIPHYLSSIELLAEDKDKAVAFNRLGEAYRKINDYEKAFLAFQKADILDGRYVNPNIQVRANPQPEEEVMEQPVAAELLDDDEELIEDKSDNADDPLANFEKVQAQPAGPEADLPAPESLPADEVESPAGAAAAPEEHLPGWLADVHRNNRAATGDEARAKRIPQWLVIGGKESSTAGGENAEESPARPLGQFDPYAREQENFTAEETVYLAEDSAEVKSIIESSTEKVGEAAYEEYLKDVVEPMNILSDHVDEVQGQMPQAKISKDGEALLAMETRNAQVLNELGNMQLKSGLLDDAIASYSKAIELERNFAWPYSNLALAYVQKGFFTEAILLYQRSIELFYLDKDKAVTWNRLGNVYRRLNDYDNAIAAYRTADELDPENSILALRSSFGLLGNSRPEKKVKAHV
jgi:superkiller protein 3